MPTNNYENRSVVVRVPDFCIARGQDGLSAYEQAVAGGYEGTEAQFNQELSSFKTLHDETETAATAAAESATSAGQSATAAAGSAENAASSASSSATSAAAASASAGSAADSASNAASSAASAASSADSADSSASTATQKASEASTSATAASASAASAAGSATNAASSATAASASATAAGNAQTAAETAQGKAEDAQEAAEQAQSDAEAAAQSVSQSAAQISQNASDISDLKSAFDYHKKNVTQRLVTNCNDRLTLLSNSYVNADGQITASSSWRSYYCKTEDITNIYAELYGSTSTYTSIAFYSGLPSDSTYISGLKFRDSDEYIVVEGNYKGIFRNVNPPQNAVYVLFCNRNDGGTDFVVNGVPFNIPDEIVLGQAISSAIRSDVNKIYGDTYYSIINDVILLDNYYVNASGVITYSSSWRAYYFSIDDFALYYSDLYSGSDGIKVVAFYSDTPTDASYISGLRWDSGELISTGLRRFMNVIIPPQTKYIMLSTRKASGNDTAIFGLNKNTVALINEAKNSQSNIKAIYYNIWNANDFCFVGDELWLAKTETMLANCEIRRYKIIDGTITYLSTLLTDFGHWNTVDYNSENDCLVFGNGGNDSSTEGNWFAVVPNPRALSGTVELSNVGIKYDVNVGFKVQAVWGDSNLGRNNIVYLISNSARTITKVLLLKDTNGNFNGQFVTLETINDLETIGVAGADYWDDTLYIGDGTKYSYHKMSLTEHTYEEVARKYYDASGTEIIGSTQGIVVDRYYLWVFINVAGSADNALIQYYR